MDKIKLIKEIEHIALTYEFDEVVKDSTYEEFIEDWGKDVYECIYIDYIYNEELEKIIIEDLIYSKKYTEDEITYIKDYMNGYYFDIGNKEIRLVKDKNLYKSKGDKMNNLILGNCLEKEIPKCRLLLTDIPYEEVNRKSNGLRKLDKENADKKTFEIEEFLNHIYNSFDICIIFCGQNQLSEVFTYFNELQKKKKGTVRQLVWCKSNPSPMNGEYIYLSGVENAVWFKKTGTGKMNNKCKKNYFIHSTGSSKYHPTEKNHKLLEELILDNTNENDLVVDTCMGSGSTGIVAIKNKRHFYGIELDERYFETAKERINSITEIKSVGGIR